MASEDGKIGRRTAHSQIQTDTGMRQSNVFVDRGFVQSGRGEKARDPFFFFK